MALEEPMWEHLAKLALKKPFLIKLLSFFDPKIMHSLMLGTDSHIKTRTKVSHNSMKSPHISVRPCGMSETVHCDWLRRLSHYL